MTLQRDRSPDCHLRQGRGSGRGLQPPPLWLPRLLFTVRRRDPEASFATADCPATDCPARSSGGDARVSRTLEGRSYCRGVNSCYRAGVPMVCRWSFADRQTTLGGSGRPKSETGPRGLLRAAGAARSSWRRRAARGMQLQHQGGQLPPRPRLRPPRAPDPDIVIGFIHPFTGALADFGTSDNWIVSTIQATPQYKNGFKVGGKTYRSPSSPTTPSPTPPARASWPTGHPHRQGGPDPTPSSTPETVNPVATVAEESSAPRRSTAVTSRGRPGTPTWAATRPRASRR